ncbi:MAG: GNAT family N-acetyltransferase [Alphaproteobacteria bacterium]|nr:GNAT family N-acetyltransferase [Alphaproteobacteria bacterium]
MIFSQTDRLALRVLEKNELPRLVKLFDVWDVVRLLEVVPYPYTMKDAEEFYANIEPCYRAGEPQFYAMALKSDNLLIGGVGLHAPRGSDSAEGDVELGYWLGKDFWGQGLMTEAARVVLGIGFARSATRAIVATTAPNNRASQNVLAKIGLRNLGPAPRDYTALRGNDEVVKWQITREEYEAKRVEDKTIR